MSAWVPSLAHVALACGGALAAASLVTAPIAAVLAPKLAQGEPESRHRALFALSAMPAIFAALAAGAVLSTPALALWHPALDHCLRHADLAHTHLCFSHPPPDVPKGVTLGVLLVALALAAARLAHLGVGLTRAALTAHALRSASRFDAALGAHVLDVPQPVALTAGLLRPRVFVTRGLLQRLDAANRAVVLAHERAHVRRRDPLVALMAELCATVHLPSVARRLRAGLGLAAEQACDEAAARGVGDRRRVAEALVAVARAGMTDGDGPRSFAAAGATRFAGENLERRVESLLDAPGDEPAAVRLVWAAFAGGVLATVAAAHPLHHAAEALLALVTH